MKHFGIVLIGSLAAACAAHTAAPAASVEQASNSSSTEPDFTPVVSDGTASVAGDPHPDRRITQQIRQAVGKERSLSFTAKNVRIITINGKVTLRGPVKTDAERIAIESVAKKVAGAGQVDNFLEVKN